MRAHSDPEAEMPASRRRFLGMAGAGAVVAGTSALGSAAPAGAVTADDVQDALTRAVGYDVTDPEFGAIGSGAVGTDAADTAGIQAAINTASNDARWGTNRARVVIPPGIYRINAPLVIESKSVEIIGAGIANPSNYNPRPGAGTTLVWTGNSNESMFFIKDCLNSEIRDMLISALNGSPGRAAFYMEGNSSNGSTGNNSHIQLRNLRIGSWAWTMNPTRFTGSDMRFDYGVLVAGYNAENDQFVFEDVQCDHCDVGIAIQGTQHVWGILRNCFINRAFTACVQTIADVLIENLQVNGSPIGLQVFGSPLVKVDQMQGEGVARYILVSGTSAKVSVKGGRMKLGKNWTESGAPPPIEFTNIANGMLSLEGVHLDTSSPDVTQEPSIKAKATSGGATHDGYLIIRDCHGIYPSRLDVSAKPVGPGNGRVILDLQSRGEVVYVRLSEGQSYDTSTRQIDYVDDRIAADHPTINNQAGTADYTVASSDADSTIVRYTPGTTTWPSNDQAPLPIGTRILHSGAMGPVQHLAGPGATIDGTIVQLPGDTVTAVKWSLDGWYLIGNGVVPRRKAQGGAAYSLGLADQRSTLEFSSSSPVTVTVPSSADVPWIEQEACEIAAFGTGTVTIVGAAGVTISSLDGSNTLAGQFAAATLRYRGSNSWHLSGQLA